MDPSTLKIVHYPYPTLRYKSKPIQRVDTRLRNVIRQMFQLMYDANGVGLAANQVDLPLRVFVVNLAANPEEGEEHVFINPVVLQPKGLDVKEEGCLSIPGVNGDVRRPERVRVRAYNLEGRELDYVADGMLARVIQHELDHLDGVLFTDRLSTTGKLLVKQELDDFTSTFRQQRERGELPDDQQIASRLREIEKEYA